MIKSIKKSYITIFLTSLIFSNYIFCQNYNIDYYGIVATEIDSNMTKMTSDLYYTQLSEINNFSTTDMRTENSSETAPDLSILSDTRLSFFTEILKNTDSDTWNVIFHVIDKNKNTEQTATKTYDSFYKILMEPKSSLQASIKNLIENNKQTAGESPVKTTESQSSDNFNTESLSGTWTGENFVDKVVILRGGRGFVIFNNGASMNISVEIDSKKQVVITQKGKSNASFFPELPRNLALNAALSAEPIIWKFSIIDSNTLQGLKKTLVSTADNYDYENVQVTWNRVN